MTTKVALKKSLLGAKRLFSQTDDAAATSEGTSDKRPQVDDHVPGRDQYTVAQDPALGYLSCYLMNSNGANNNNKYYILQVLERGSQYFLWTRYGRVGKVGDSKLDRMGPLISATKSYQKTYKQKTGARGYTPIKVALAGQDKSKV